MLPDAAVAQYQSMQRLQVATLLAVRRLWASMGTDFDPSWEAISKQLFTVVSAAQLAAAGLGAGFVAAVLAELGVDVEPDGSVVTEALSGQASDGRDLDGLLFGAVITAKEAVGGGAAVSDALAQGGRFLDMAARTQVADASREASGVGIAARVGVGWVRMVNPPCCGRCAILAGRFYRWSSGFQRHNRCDCVNIACTEDTAGDVRTSPQRLFSEGHVRGLSKVDAQAISEGADPGQVVNAHRGMSTAQVYGRKLAITHEGTTRRGLAYTALRENRVNNGGADMSSPASKYRRINAPRLMPSAIYSIAEDRADAIRLLRLNGYIRD